MFRKLAILVLILFYQISFSQSRIKSFFKLSRPEKCWVISHPFKASFALKSAEESRKVSDTIKMDGDKNGGQIDAFRHAYWMALMSQKMKPEKAIRLGEKHEKGNYLEFKNSKLEDGSLPDSVAGLMDLKNNEIGAELGYKNPNLSKTELIELVKSKIEQGNFWIIRKTKNGDYQNCDGRVIEIIKQAKIWGIPKCLVPSNSIRE